LTGWLISSAETQESIYIPQKYATKEKMRVVKGQVFSYTDC